MIWSHQGFCPGVLVHGNKFGTYQICAYNHAVFHKYDSDLQRARGTSGASHDIAYTFLPLVILPEGHAELAQQLAAMVIGFGGCYNGNFHSTGFVDLVILNFSKDQLLI